MNRSVVMGAALPACVALAVVGLAFYGERSGDAVRTDGSSPPEVAPPQFVSGNPEILRPAPPADRAVTPEARFQGSSISTPAPQPDIALNVLAIPDPVRLFEEIARMGPEAREILWILVMDQTRSAGVRSKCLAMLCESSPPSRHDVLFILDNEEPDSPFRKAVKDQLAQLP